MNTNSKDVVKSVESNKVESTSNEQRQTNKPIVISRRRLLRAGVAGIPVVLTMAGVAPGQSIMGQASAASGLVYGGTGVGVRDRFEGDDRIVQDNLVWSNNNGFVIDKRNNKLFTADISTQSRNDPSDNSITLKASGTSVTKNVTVTPKPLSSSSNGFTFNAYLHKSGVYYTDFVITQIGNTAAVTPQTIQQYFQSLNTVSEVLDYFTFTVDGNQLGSSDITAASVTDVSVAYLNAWTETEGYEMGSDSETRKYYLVPGSAADAFTVTLKVTATISKELNVTEGTGDDQTTTPYTFSCSSGTMDGTTSTITLTFNVSGQTYTGN